MLSIFANIYNMHYNNQAISASLNQNEQQIIPNLNLRRNGETVANNN